MYREIDQINNKLSKNIPITLEYVVFNLKSILTSKVNMSLVIFMLLLGTILPVIFFPYKMVGGALILFYLIIPIFVILGWLSYSFRYSTMFGNVHVSGYSKNWWYISQIITVFIIGNILTIIFWIIMFIFGESGILLEDWAFFNGGREEPLNIFQELSWAYIIYVSNLTILVTFAIYFIIKSFTTNIKTYFVVILALSIFDVIFGGTLNTYWIRGINEQGYMEVLPNKVLFPVPLFWVSIINPFYGVGQMTTTTITRNAVSGDPNGLNFFIFGFSNEMYMWTIVLIQPYAWILISFFIGSLYNRN